MKPGLIGEATAMAGTLRALAGGGNLDLQEAFENCITAWRTVDKIVPHEHILEQDQQAFSSARGMVRLASDGKHNGFIGLEGASQIADMLERAATGTSKRDRESLAAMILRKSAQPRAAGVPVVSTKRTLFKLKDDPAKKRVFIVHGHDDKMKLEVKSFLQDIGLIPIVLHEQPNGGRTIIEKFEKNADVGFAVVLLSPDDQGCVAKKGLNDLHVAKPRARQNVILELGYFMGALGRSNVCALVKGDDLETPGDLDGLVYIPFKDNWKTALMAELKEAEMDFDASKAR